MTECNGCKRDLPDELIHARGMCDECLSEEQDYYIDREGLDEDETPEEGPEEYENEDGEMPEGGE